jgi:hypothetical protein
MKQISLFKPEDLPPRILYEKLFENLPHLSSNEKEGGRPPTSRNFILKTLIYKALRRIHSLTDIVFELKNNLSLLASLGRRCFDENPFNRAIFLILEKHP